MVYKCGDCDKDYEKKEYLQQHIRLKHPRSVKSVQCVKCDKYFVTKYSLNKHLYNAHPSKLHSCSFCGSIFKASIDTRNKSKSFCICC